MTCYCDDGNGIQSCYLLYLFGQCADGSRMGHLAKLFSLQSDTFHEVDVEIAGHRIQNLRSRCYGIFADGVAGEHIAQCIRDEENLVGILQSHVSCLAHGIHLEQ